MYGGDQCVEDQALVRSDRSHGEDVPTRKLPLRQRHLETEIHGIRVGNIPSSRHHPEAMVTPVSDQPLGPHGRCSKVYELHFSFLFWRDHLRFLGAFVGDVCN